MRAEPADGTPWQLPLLALICAAFVLVQNDQVPRNELCGRLEAGSRGGRASRACPFARLDTVVFLLNGRNDRRPEIEK